MSRNNYRLTKLRDGSSRLSKVQYTGESAAADGPFRNTEYGSGLLKDSDQEPIQFRVFSNSGSLVAYFPWFCAETVNFSLGIKIQQFITQDGEKLVNNGPAISMLEIAGYIPLLSINDSPVKIDLPKNARGTLSSTNTQYSIPTSVNPNLPDLFVEFYDSARVSYLAYTGGSAEVVVDGIRCTGGFVSRTSEIRADRPNITTHVLSFVCTNIATPYQHTPIQKISDKAKPPTEAEKNAKPSR